MFYTITDIILGYKPDDLFLNVYIIVFNIHIEVDVIPIESSRTNVFKLTKPTLFSAVINFKKKLNRVSSTIASKITFMLKNTVF